jgi:Sugar (and other) transporter/SIS domain
LRSRPGIVWLDVTRFFLGVSIGILTVAAPVFIAESAPRTIRGALIVGYQVATVVGIMVAYFADYALASSSSWRLMLGLSAVVSALVLIVLLRLPDTPRWYLMRGRREEAVRTLQRLIVVACGYLHGAAEEAALKTKETCSLMADGYSSADLRHGPIAAVTSEVPVVALNAPGPTEPDMTALIGELRKRGSKVLVVGGQDDADLPLPRGMPEALAPIVAVVRAQQLARTLALQLGYDPDSPEGLSKVTIT